MIAIKSTQAAVLSEFFPIPSGGTRLAVAIGLAADEEIPVLVKSGDQTTAAKNPDGTVIKLTQEINMALLAGEATYLFDKPETDDPCQVTLGD
jgi:hypothetical protein